MFAGQLEQGWEYESLAKTIGISLVDFVVFPEIEDLHSTYRMYDAAHGRELSDILELHFIELTKFKKDKAHSLLTPFEKWLHILRFAEIYEKGVEPVPEGLKAEEGIEMALDAMKRAYASDEVREMSEFREKAMHDEASRLGQARREGLEQGLERGLERGLEQGLERGLEQGLERGLERGLEQGLERGLEQGLERGLERGLEQGLEQVLERGKVEGKREAARQLLAQGMDRQEILRLLDLQPDDLA